MYKLSNKFKRAVAVFFLINFLAEVFYPTAAMALTSGPAQPEATNFEPVGTSDMVDPFTGDYTYNVPLIDVGGYPVNISYHSGPTMDQEATWTGLGWNVNVGAINRNMRGVPDDFSGDIVTKEMNIKPNITYGVTLGAGGEIFGSDAISANYSLGVSWNNYIGYGITQTAGISVSVGDNVSLGLGLTSSADGLTISPKVSFSAQMDSKENSSLKGSVSIGTSFNSRTGMQKVSLDAGVSVSSPKDAKKDKAGNEVKDMHNGKENKHGNSAGGLSTGASYSFGASTYVPQLSMSMKNTSYFFSGTVGGTLWGVDVSATISGNYAKQELQRPREDFAAFGYMNAQSGQPKDKVMQDFNRDLDGAYSDNTPDLPLTNVTYDVFSVAGQGVGGSYRPFRNDMGYVFDSRVNTTSENSSLATDINLGSVVQGGFDYSNTRVTQSSGKWVQDNNSEIFLKFKGDRTGGIKDYEAVYFKEAGEKAVDDDPLYDYTLGDKAARIPLQEFGTYDVYAIAQLESENSDIENLRATNYRTKRAIRNNLFSYLTRKEYDKVAVDKSLSSVINSNAKDHHIAEIITTKTDGTRYVYGIPAYNTYQKEASFNVNSSSNTIHGPGNSMVEYASGIDNSTGNTKGIDNFYTSTELPAFAYAYMLTAVLSPDYVDVTGNGLSKDDLGDYKEFKYIKVDDEYNWRTPFGNPSSNSKGDANFNEGLKTVPDDNRGSYVYGRKEIYYLSEIVTKNYIAFFETIDRRDGVGVKDERGGLGAASVKQKLLKSITLYSKPDYDANGANAFVIKKVHFVYNYDLCRGVDNNDGTIPSGSDCELSNNGGKLTLQKIFFTYGNSQKAKLSPYTFEYHTAVGTNANVPYDAKAYDRWGNFKPSPTVTTLPPNSEFPYVEQDQNKADEYTRLWNLKAINLPSGGRIDITYESDDYGYVQDKRAAQMFKIIAAANPENNATLTDKLRAGANNPTPYVSASDVASTNNKLFENGGNDKNTILFFKLQKEIDMSNYADYAAMYKDFKKKYLENITDLYFRFFTNVNNQTNNGGHEYVSGYGTIDASGLVSEGTSGGNNTFKYGWIELKKVCRGDKKSTCTFYENPISRAAWQFGRMHTPLAVYSANGSNPDPEAKDNFITSVANASFIKNILETFQGANGTLKDKGYGSEFDPNKSWVRLNSPYKQRLGGGCRVKQISISDEWGGMLVSGTGKTFNYGQEYSYTTVDPSTHEIISSGVAAYEPSFGADENPLRVPIYNLNKKEELLLAPDNDLYLEAPYGESFYPAPTVGYSEVTVKNLQRYNTPGNPNSGLKVSMNATGKIVHEFYTAKDFPVIATKAPLVAKHKKTNPLLQLLNINLKDYVTVSEGYCVQINDMAGKQERQSVYDETGNLISRISYFYKHSGNRLVNEAPTIDKEGKISTKRIGVDYDVVADFREQTSDSETFDIQGNLYFMLVGVYPLLVPPILPKNTTDKKRFRSSVITKVINRFGLLDRTVAEDLGSAVETANVAWDAVTGDVLLTRTSTEFKDDIYSFNYPVHWSYTNMSGGYKNIGLKVNNVFAGASPVINPSTYKVSASYANLLVPGDELEVTVNNTIQSEKAWVHKTGTDLYVINKTGAPGLPGVTGSGNQVHLKVIRSGCRNMSALSSGAFTSYKNPIDPDGDHTLLTQWPGLNSSFGILNATSTEYSDKWKIFCECGIDPDEPGNPYIAGLLGNWRQKKGYTYLTLRDQTKVNDNSNIRVDGTFRSFDPFWSSNGGNDWNVPTDLANPYPKWTWASEVTEYSPYGFELENKDALNRFSAALYGYNNSLPTAVGSNSQYKQLASDGFEDYFFTECNQEHFSFKENHKDQTHISGNNSTQTTSHTGKKSLKVGHGQPPAQVIKVLHPCTGEPPAGS